MASTKNYDFTNPSEYTFNNNLIQVANGKANLIIQNQNTNYEQTFDNDTGFTYDNTKAEFVAGAVQKKDVTPANSLIYNDYNTKDARWSNGSSIGTLIGAASVSGGNLILPTGSNNYIEYNAASNMPVGNTGTVRLRYRPQYSGSPGINQYIFASSQGNNNIANLVRFLQIGTNIRWDLFDSAGLVIKTVQTGNIFNPIAGVLYELELNFDTTTGQYRLFIDGININGLQTSAPKTRNQTAGIIRFGKDYTSSANNVVSSEVEDFIFFDSVQHTANYTPDWNIPLSRYLESQVDLPAFNYTGGIGTFLTAQSLSTVQTGLPGYQIKIGTGSFLYWDGLAWAASDGTYSQSTDLVTFNTNISALDVNGESSVIVRIVFASDNNQATVDNLIFEVNQDILYPITNPTIETNDAISANELLSFIDIKIVGGSDQIRYILSKGSVWYYWNGLAWVVSDESFAQSSTQSDINANITSFFASDNALVKIRAFLSSNDGTTTPELDNIQIVFSEQPTFTESTITGNIYDIGITAPDIQITVRPGNYLFGNLSIITNASIDVTYDNVSGNFTAVIKVENIEPDELIWSFGEREVRTKYTAGAVNFGALARIYP